MQHKPTISAAICLVALLAPSRAQTPVQSQSATPSFEVASVKPSPPNGHPFMSPFAGGRFRATFTRAVILIELAYHVDDYQLSGGPKWIWENRFDVEASAGRSVSLDETRLMFQTLLADRFKLKVHRETRESTVYALVQGKKGTKLEPAGTDPSLKRGFLPERLSRSSARITAQKATMRDFANWLGGVLSTPVSDETGLEGNYRFTLEYELPDARPDVDSSATAPSLFTALQEQLGLKLEARKGTAEILVIDHVELPSEN